MNRMNMIISDGKHESVTSAGAEVNVLYEVVLLERAVKINDTNK